MPEIKIHRDELRVGLQDRELMTIVTDDDLDSLEDLIQWAAYIADDEPTTWSLPPEPGPEVLAVRGSRLWTRQPSGWASDGFKGVSWTSIIEYDRPLTDATAELSTPEAGTR